MTKNLESFHGFGIEGNFLLLAFNKSMESSSGSGKHRVVVAITFLIFVSSLLSIAEVSYSVLLTRKYYTCHDADKFSSYFTLYSWKL